MSNPFFTLFTPAYNCEKTIHRVFNSVKEQTFRNFEWIIINDGSKDNSSLVIKNLIKSFEPSDIQITFLEFENYGKHIVWNKGVRLGKGLFFVPADADDSFLPETLEFFFKKISLLSENKLEKISGINVLCFENETDNISGDLYPEDGLITNNFELAYKQKIKGEKWGCIKMDLLKQYPFPEINNSYYPEDYLWFSLSKTYQVICFNKALRRYFTNDSGLTSTSIYVKSRSVKERKATIKYYSWLLVNFGFKILKYSPKMFARHIGRTLIDISFILFN